MSLRFNITPLVPSLPRARHGCAPGGRRKIYCNDLRNGSGTGASKNIHAHSECECVSHIRTEPKGSLCQAGVGSGAVFHFSENAKNATV